MPTLQDILQSHEGSDFTPKMLAEAGRYRSVTSAYNLLAHGSEHWDWMIDLLPRLPRPVAQSMLAAMAGTINYGIAPAERADDGELPLRTCIDLAGKWATFTGAFLDALADGRICENEDGQLEKMLQEIERGVSRVRDAKNKRRMKLRTA